VNFLERGIDLIEKFCVPPARLAAGFADVEVMDLAVKSILKTLPYAREGKLLNDVELLKCFAIAINAGAIHPRKLFV
jgi:hypothetical protein